jgi:hypothetical protein
MDTLTEIQEFNVVPINTISEGIEKGNYTETSVHSITSSRNLMMEKIPTESKAISIICFNQQVRSNSLNKKLRLLGYKVSDYGAHYLLGLMAMHSKELPESLRNKSLIAASKNYFVVQSTLAWLSVDTIYKRKLDMVYSHKGPWTKFHAFIAEKI